MVSVRKGTTMTVSNQDVVDSVSIIGYEDLQQRLDGIPNDINNAILHASQEIAELMKETATLLVPVDTGALRSSINTDILPTSNGAEVSLGTNLHYAPYVEFGTGVRGSETGRAYGDHVAAVDYSIEHKGQRAQPFIRPALYDNENNIRTILQEHIDKEMKE